MAKKQLFKLAKHQVYASEMMDASDVLAIFYEAGTGKTMCVLDWLYRKFKNNEIKNALIVCPANLVSNWDASIDKMLLFEGYTAYGVRRMHEMIEIRSFQRTYTNVVTTTRKRDGTVKEKKVIKTRDDIAHPWGAIIVDESQGLGAHNSSQTKSLLKMIPLTTHRYILSGTPVSGGGGQQDYKKLYGQLTFLDPELWPSWTAFCRELVTQYDNFNKPIAYRNEDCLSLMKAYGIVARLQDCYDMPDSIDTVIPITLAEPIVYNDVVDGHMKPYNIDIKSGGGKFIKLMELCSGFLKTIDEKSTPYDCNKLLAVKDIIEGTDDKIVIFCSYRYSIDAVAKLCSKYGKTIIYDGRLSEKDKTIYKEFQEGNARFIVCQYLSGGTGIDLYASHTMIFYEPSFSSLIMEQSKARIMRKGQEKKCLYYWLSTKNTIEAKVVETVQNGLTASTEMLNEWAKEKTLVKASASMTTAQIQNDLESEDTPSDEEVHLVPD